VLIDRDATVGVLFGHYLLKSFVTELVAIFKAAIVLTVFLDSVVGQMDILVIDILKVYLEFTATCP
jgi:hypothetical protein